jgi:hypothetical protein
VNKLELGLWEIENNKHLIESYTPIIKAAGYKPENIACLTGPDCYFLATDIRHFVRPRAKEIIKGCFSETDYIGALKKMTLGELHAMRLQINYQPSRPSCRKAK